MAIRMENGIAKDMVCGMAYGMANGMVSRMVGLTDQAFSAAKEEPDKVVETV